MLVRQLQQVPMTLPTFRKLGMSLMEETTFGSITQISRVLLLSVFSSGLELQLQQTTME
jgi:hypothetical protein